ncbi:uncharacterized protein LOC101738576 [Bombyx mori]|uniref:Uncharacterized protein n=1 Tax=Bombyx mori TaxID=7091 RepID=A0A8R2ALZ7_BOMMO|nr:MAR-binding filament-like protein 1 isoform X1 [Bombyx mori]
MDNTNRVSRTKSNGPRILPRPTAASAARAARNATNRNLSLTQKQSPSRAPPSPVPSRTGKVITEHVTHKIESISDMKVQNECYIEPIQPELDRSTTESMPQHTESFVIEQMVTVNSEEEMELKNEQTALESDNKENSLDCEPVPKSAPNSRPQTPKTLQGSRPQTPRPLSRPTTPLLLQQSSSRPNTPRRPTTPVRPKTPIQTTIEKSRQSSPVTQASRLSNTRQLDEIKSTFVSKHKQFNSMKKDLDLKQQAVLEVFQNLKSLYERLNNEGISACGEGFLPQELILFNVADWTAQEVAQLYRDAIASSTPENALELLDETMPIDECALEKLNSKVMNVSDCFTNLCHKAFAARQEVIDWVKNLFENLDQTDGDILEHLSRYNDQGFELCGALRELKTQAEDAVNTVTDLSKRACHERRTLIAVGEALVREVAKLRQDVETRNVMIDEIRELRSESENTKALEEMRHELDEERTAKLAIKEKLTTTESQLRQTRNRVAKMDKQLREAEASITSLTGTVKMLEDQSRQKEVQLEARARKLRESLKTGEVTTSQLIQQRDSLQAEVLECKQQIEKLTVQHKSAIQQLEEDLKQTKRALQEQCEITKREIELKERTETELQDSRNAIEELQAKIIELEKSKPNPDLPTEREIDLWAELQATKETLRVTEDEVTTCKREKVRFLETLTKITESENKIGIQQKLAAELLNKEEIIGKMQIQTRELIKNIKLNEQKVIQYEQYVRDLQAHNRTIANCQESPNGISYQDLQQEIMDLKMKLLDVVHRNEELSEILAKKDQELEQQDKNSRGQARVIKIREELINVLKNKETEQSRELAALQQDLEHRMRIVDEVNKQIAAKADEIQELFATLENKQQQIHRLEKIVLALEEQQRRAQAQRTRHEEKIAALEHELAAGLNRKERKFLFF